MTQVFRSSANTIARGSLAALLVLILGGSWMAMGLSRSPYFSQVTLVREQPVPFSHEHHVAVLGIDCRYCHTTVEESKFAGMPTTETCMQCHSQIWSDAPMLAPVRESWRTGTPIHWTRVHDLPDFVQFDHGVHVANGIGCSTCHGRVDAMPLMYKAESLFMQWCLDCHREPERFVRPADKIYDMAWQPGPDQVAQGRRLIEEEYHIQVEGLTNCSKCHY